MSGRIVAERLTRVYRSGKTSTIAVDAVDLTVAAGEVVLLMGPSGSGKSTLLSMLGCILRPTSGRVLLNGQDVTNLRAGDLARVRLCEIGLIFQDASLFPSLTAADNVEMPLELQGIRGRRAHDRSAELLASVGLSSKLREMPRDLSGGERQRVAIARALAVNPGIVLADEPTAALDLASGRNVFGHLRRLAEEEGRAVVAVTHDHRMEEFATRIVRLEDGKLVREEAAG
jgi:putative ABC transport system ATP-binding protein